jgi:hypothetical protein
MIIREYYFYVILHLKIIKILYKKETKKLLSELIKLDCHKFLKFVPLYPIGNLNHKN